MKEIRDVIANTVCKKCEEGRRLKIDNEPMFREKISLCPHCFCMTKTIKGKCGKCKCRKDKGYERD